MEFLNVTFDLMYHDQKFNTTLTTNRQYDLKKIKQNFDNLNKYQIKSVL